MRCPKCGYNSFDHLDSCKKCGKDLIEHKQRFGIVSVLFPGQMQPAGKAVEVEDESSVAEAAVAAATATTVVATAAAAVATTEAATADTATASASDGDDFGFDFMGDSEEEDDLSFDELFEEAPTDEDVEETLPAPEKSVSDDDGEDDFSFDLDTDDGEDDSSVSELDADFGFDPSDDATVAEEPAVAAPEKLGADDFELPLADNDDFSFDADNIEFEETADAGTEGDPKNPFDLPESPLFEEAPEQKADLFAIEPTVGPEVGAGRKEDQLLSPVPAVGQQGNDAQLWLAVDDVPATDVVMAGPTEADSPFETAAALGAEPAPAAESLSSVIDPIAPAESVEQVAGSVDEPLTEAAAPALLDVATKSVENVEISKQGLVEVGVTAGVLGAVALDRSGSVGDGETALEPAPEDLPADESGFAPDGGVVPTTGRRIAAFACDLLLLFAVGVSFVISAEAAIATESGNFLPTMSTLIDLSVPYFLVLFSLVFAYFTLFHFLAGQTPGKMLVGLRVETVAGDPLLFSQAFLRSVGGLLQLLPVGIGFLLVLFNPAQRGWNDRLAGTRLISLKGLPEEA